MEQYVYFSIMFFSLIIFFLYIYIVYEKIVEIYKNKKMKEYNIEVIPYVNSTVNKIINGQDIDYNSLGNIKKYCRNKYKREIVQERLLYYLENFKGDFSQNITKLCEYIGIVQYDINNLKKQNYHIKALAAKILGQFRSKDAVEALMKEAYSKDNDVKYNVLMALAKIGEEDSFISVFESIDSSVDLSERSLIEIVDSFEGDKNKIYRHMINSDNNFIACVFIKSLGNYKDMSLNKDISEYLSGEDKERRIAAVKAIGNMSDVRYLNNIIELLEDNEWEVRAVTARVLSNFTNSKILIPLAKSLSDSQWYVRYNAAISILNHDDGIDTISYVFQGKDKFAKDIIISAMENSPNNRLYLYENSSDDNKRALAIKIKKYKAMKKKDEEYEPNIN